MLGKRDPLDDIFTEKELIDTMKSLKLNKSKFDLDFIQIQTTKLWPLFEFPFKNEALGTK